jgi:two-component system, cell cycle sensor histidine kinase and response regulator CckA
MSRDGGETASPAITSDIRQKEPILVNTAPSPHQTILLAEDEDAIRRLVCRLLQESGFEVIAATNGKDALQKAQEHDGKIDLLLSNIDMPEMTGIELAAQIALARPETKVMFVSALPSGTLVLDGSWQFLPKPFMPNMLKERIHMLLSGR